MNQRTESDLLNHATFFNENDRHARILALYVLVSVYSEKISLRQALSRLATLHASSIYQFLAVLHIVPSSCGQINGEQTFDQNSVKIGNLAVFPEILRSTPPRPALTFTSYMHANLFKSLLTR